MNGSAEWGTPVKVGLGNQSMAQIIYLMALEQLRIPLCKQIKSATVLLGVAPFLSTEQFRARFAGMFT